MKRYRFAALLCAILLIFAAGCAPAASQPSAPAPAEPAPESQEDTAPPAEAGHDVNAFRMTQAAAVRNEKFREQEVFADFLSMGDSCYLIPGLKEAMTPQGISYSEATGLAYVTSYAITSTPSAISAVDPSTGEFAAEYYLFQEDGSPFTSHVGGIAVAGDQVYLSAKLDNDGSYSIAQIPLAGLPAAGSHDVTVKHTIPLPVSPSFLNYSEGILWVGNFYHPKGDYNLSTGMNFTTASADGEYGCYILGFPLEPGESLAPADGEKYPAPAYVLAAPDKIQGCVMVGDTIWLSQSYGRTANSTLLAYRLPELGSGGLTIPVDGKEVPAHILDSQNQTAAVTAMPMTEGLCLGPDGSVLVLFESGSNKYSDGKYRTDHVWKLSV